MKVENSKVTGIIHETLKSLKFFLTDGLQFQKKKQVVVQEF